METSNSKVLKNIKELREYKGFSQEFVASKLGMKQAGYGLIESGERGLRYEVLLQIAMIFECSVIDIITYPDKYAPACDNPKAEATTTRVLVELDVSADEFIKLGLKEKILQILDK